MSKSLIDPFAVSPEGQATTQTGTRLEWAQVMIHYAINYPGLTPNDNAEQLGGIYL